MDTQTFQRQKHVYFEPDNQEDVKGFEVIEEIYQCIVCKRMPLYQQQCQNCMRIICRTCEEQAIEGNAKCPSEDCQKTLVTQEVQAGVSSFALSKLTQKHSCTTKTSEEIENKTRYTLTQLHSHLENDCPLSRFCKECEKEFQTIELYRAHLI